MQTQNAKTVRDLAAGNPAAARVFERFGIDYCCGGEKSLAEACATAEVSVDEVEAALEKPVPEITDRDWQKATLAELTAHIVMKHHEFTREEIRRLLPLIAKVVGVHGQNHPELKRVQALFHGLANELTMHMMKEERMLFPYIEELEAATNRGSEPAPPMFGTVQNPVRMMMMEHDSAGSALHGIRESTSSYAVPADACVSYHTLYNALEEFESDLHQHIHLENNILFPRAIKLEAGAFAD
jgi:regulator of cell morphogenesis and NO signaling